MEWAQYGIREQEQLKRHDKCHDTREYHQPYIQVIDLVRIHQASLIVQNTIFFISPLLPPHTGVIAPYFSFHTCLKVIFCNSLPHFRKIFHLMEFWHNHDFTKQLIINVL